MTFKLRFESFNEYESFIENFYAAFGSQFGIYSPNRVSAIAKLNHLGLDTTFDLIFQVFPF